jgi:abequosyltransferase
MPTYNFGKFIGETIDSILPQMNEFVELVILDGASTDNTEQIVHTYIKNSKHTIVYHRLPQKGGIDRDLECSVTFATGQYIWLFSSDDLMKKGAILRALLEIESGLDVYLLSYSLCNFDMEKIVDSRMFNDQQDRIYDLSNKQQREVYFKKAQNSEPFFSFMSSLLINRKKWNESSINLSYYGTCWAHVPRIFNFMPNGLKVKIITTPLFDKRSGNDSFMDKGLIHRIGIAIYGYKKISDDIFGHNSFEAFHISRAIRNEVGLRMLLCLKSRATNAHDLSELNKMVRILYKNSILKYWMMIVLYKVFSVKTCCYIHKVRKNIRDFLKKH